MKREDLHIRDPFIYTENGIYYLLGTTGNDSWDRGSDLVLYVSRDLERLKRNAFWLRTARFLPIKTFGRPNCIFIAGNII